MLMILICVALVFQVIVTFIIMFNTTNVEKHICAVCSEVRRSNDLLERQIDLLQAMYKERRS